MAATAEKMMTGAAGTTQYLVFVVINLMLTSLFIKKILNSLFGICCDQFNVNIIIYLENIQLEDAIILDGGIIVVKFQLLPSSLLFASRACRSSITSS